MSIHDLIDEEDLRSIIPALADETALQMSELLQHFIDRFDACYDRQIIRAYREREKERERCTYRRWLNQAQQSLPFLEEDSLTI